MPNPRKLTITLVVLCMLCAGAAARAERTVGGRRVPLGASSRATLVAARTATPEASSDLAHQERVAQERLRLALRIARLLGLTIVPELPQPPIYVHVIDGPDPVGNTGDNSDDGRNSHGGAGGGLTPLGGGRSGQPPIGSGDDGS